MSALTEEAAERYVAEHSFVTGAPGFVGAVVQFLATPLMPGGPVPAGPVFHRLRHGHLTGALDDVLSVSTPPSPGLDVCERRTAEDLAMARDLLARHGLAPGERALDPYPGADRQVRRGTAGVRVCLDAGLDGAGPAGLARRWAVAHSVGPVLVAAFANSPLRDGRPTGWRSTRQALRSGHDTALPSGHETALRSGHDTARPSGHAIQESGGGPAAAADGVLTSALPDPRRAWAHYAMDAPFRGGATFRQRLRGPYPPNLADLREHLDRLPAPVRARGHLELDMIDAQPGDGWRVALAVATALVDDPTAANEAIAATRSLPADAWIRAARDALTDPVLAEAARHCFVAAYAALARQGATRHLRDAVADHIDRYVNRSRCPADDVLRTTTTKA